MKRKKIIRYIVLPLLVIGAVAAIYIYKEYNRKHKDTAKVKADYSILLFVRSVFVFGCFYTKPCRGFLFSKNMLL